MTMRIEVNGVEREVQDARLDAILNELGFAEAKVATAVNGDFVPLTARAERQLQPGDRLEVVAPMQGG
ncbi:MAG TPA: sulfur carrier protein ThiS [Kiloniellales bacterium]|jgi:sulfur carrier protein|nr:sulfur carrier protein ThiS [Kiloniellales bacterium]